MELKEWVLNDEAMKLCLIFGGGYKVQKDGMPWKQIAKPDRQRMKSSKRNKKLIRKKQR